MAGRLAANKAIARAALSLEMAEFIDAPEADKEATIKVNTHHMYFRYDTETGKCTYVGKGGASPNNISGFDDYKDFVNIGYKQGGGKGETDISKWKMDIGGKRKSTGMNYSTVLTDRTYRYWDVAKQGDGTFLAIVCLW